MKEVNNKSSRFLWYAAVLGIIFCVIVPGTLLFVEYWHMKKAAQKLLELKDDYRSYTMTLERLVKERAQEFGEEELKKKVPLDLSAEEEPEKMFTLVNRDPDYLRVSAIDYARRHQLDGLLTKMFDTETWDELPVIKTFRSKKRRRRNVAAVTGMPVRSRFMSVQDRKEKPDFIFSWPVERSKFWFSSPYGPRKIGNRGWKFHHGIDLAAIRGTPVTAAAGGIVVQSGWHKGYGNCILIAHNRKYKTRYAHLHTRRVNVGQKVQRGDKIGTVGATGFVTKRGKDASHLHFEVYSFGRDINPMSVLA